MISVQAQKDVTSQYITNATLSSLSGWTNVNFDTPAKGNNTAGYATEAYAGWGSLTLTNYSLTQNITLPAGHYTLVNYSFYRYDEHVNDDPTMSLAYLKAGEQQVAIKTLGSISASYYANSKADGANCFDAKMYRNTLDFTIDADGTTIEIGLVGTHVLMRSWVICGMFELINNDIPATMDSPFDVTGYLTNSGFEYGDMTGWSLNNELETQNNNQSFKVGNYYAQHWQPSPDGPLSARSMSQTLTDLPAGCYILSANVGGSGAYLELNGKRVDWTEDKDYNISYVLADGEDLTITAGKTDEGTANWIHFDNFKLKFCGDVQDALTTLINQVSSYAGQIPTYAYIQLQNDVNAYNHSYSDVDELLAAIDAVSDLYTAADALKAPYATAKELLAEAVALTVAYPTLNANIQTFGTQLEGCTTVEQLETANAYLATAVNGFVSWTAWKMRADDLAAVPNDNAAANTAFTETINGLVYNVDHLTLDETGLNNLAEYTAALKPAMITYAGEANPVSPGKFDLTFMLTNPNLTPYWDGTWWIKPEGWFTDQEGGNFQVMQNNSVDAEDGVHKVFMEYYYLEGGQTWGNSNFNIYTKVELPEGTYTMSCYAFAKEENYSSGAPNPQVYFYANDTQGSLVDASKLTAQEISFVNNAEQEVKIGLKPLAGNTYNWMGIGYVELYKVPAKTYTVDEDEPWDYTTVGAGDVTLNRTIKEGINTVVFPFSMTQEEVEANFGEGSKVYVVSTYTAENDNITFAVHDGISANIPCLLKATVAGTSYELEDRMIVAATSAAPEYTTPDHSVTMIGGYEQENEITGNQYNYVISGGKIYFVDATLAMKATRAYIRVVDANAARELILDLDGVTAISAIEAAEDNDGEMEDGKYFIDGKIVIVNNGVKYSANGQILK